MVPPLLEGGVELYEGSRPNYILAEVAKDHILYALVIRPDKAACI
jgi:hypothetical protein